MQLVVVTARVDVRGQRGGTWSKGGRRVPDARSNVSVRAVVTGASGCASGACAMPVRSCGGRGARPARRAAASHRGAPPGWTGAGPSLDLEAGTTCRACCLSTKSCIIRAHKLGGLARRRVIVSTTAVNRLRSVLRRRPCAPGVPAAFRDRSTIHRPSCQWGVRAVAASWQQQHACSPTTAGTASTERRQLCREPPIVAATNTNKHPATHARATLRFGCGGAAAAKRRGAAAGQPAVQNSSEGGKHSTRDIRHCKLTNKTHRIGLQGPAITSPRSSGLHRWLSRTEIARVVVTGVTRGRRALGSSQIRCRSSSKAAASSEQRTRGAQQPRTVASMYF
jgi:hypothetical protein